MTTIQPRKLRVLMSQVVFYQLFIEVEADADDEAIAAAAEETFVQGDYKEIGQDDRTIDDWEDDNG